MYEEFIFYFFGRFVNSYRILIVIRLPYLEKKILRVFLKSSFCLGFFICYTGKALS